MRTIDENDRAWILALCEHKYGKHYDYVSTELWVRETVLKNPMKFFPVRSDHAFLIATLGCSPWTPTIFEAEVLLVCAEDGKMWHALHLMRASVEWAWQRKCAIWRIGVGWDFQGGELGPLARRCGAKEIKPMYMIDFRGSNGRDQFSHQSGEPA